MTNRRRSPTALNRNQAEYAALQSEVTSSRELYDTLRRKLQQASIDAEVSGVNTMSVESARVPSHPIEPKKMLVLVEWDGHRTIRRYLFGVSGGNNFRQAAHHRIRSRSKPATIFSPLSLASHPTGD